MKRGFRKPPIEISVDDFCSVTLALLMGAFFVSHCNFPTAFRLVRRRCSCVSIVTRLRRERPTFDSRLGWGWDFFFPASLCPNLLWGPPSSLFSGYWGATSLWVKLPCVKLTTYPT